MDLFRQLGRVALGTRVRFLGDKIAEDAGRVYGLYGIKMNPKWFPVFYVLSQNTDRTITSIADDIGHSHVSVSKIVTEMATAKLVSYKTSTEDRRRTMVRLTKKGQEVAKKIQDLYLDVESAMLELSHQSTHDLWKALEEWEHLLAEQPIFDRALEKKKQRESSGVKIVPYTSKHREAFRKLNTAWITQYFKMEKADHEALDHPQEYILDRGGFIFVAVIDDRPIGVCALLRREDPTYPFELAKMAVASEARGKNVGWLLGKAVIEKARSLKAKNLYLESNTVLTPAIGLYRKLGFKEVAGPQTPYERCNIQMELKLK